MHRTPPPGNFRSGVRYLTRNGDRRNHAARTSVGFIRIGAEREREDAAFPFVECNHVESAVRDRRNAEHPPALDVRPQMEERYGE